MSLRDGENIVDLGHEIENDESDGVVTPRLVDGRIDHPNSYSKFTIEENIKHKET